MRSPLASLIAAPALLVAWPAQAGPPYLTDDPEPTGRGHWEIYNFVGGAHVAGQTSGEAGVDLNYGAAKDLQMTIVIPAAFEQSDGTHFGLGVVELAAKFKVLHQSEGSVSPDVAIFPRLFLPTAPARFASQRPNLLLPVWFGKDVGKWSVFGGGGYQLNPGPGNRDFWVGGGAITRDIGERLSIGAEITHRTPDARGSLPFTGVNLGVTYKLTGHWSLLASGGPGVQNARQEGRYDFYMALKADY